MQTQSMTSEKTLFIKMVVSTWDTQNTRISKLVDTLTDDELLGETAPGRNTGVYLIGHLTAISDAMFTLLGWGDREYAHWDEVFIKNPDKSGQKFPSISELKTAWHAVNKRVSAMIEKTQPDEWFARHTAVSPTDFEKEPHRNKLNLLINRTNHHSYHYGQLAYLAKKK